MKYFVALHGNNVLMKGSKGVFKRGGFFTGIYMEAPNPEKAKELAVREVWTRTSLRVDAKNPPSDPVRIRAKKVYEATEDETQDMAMVYYIP